MADTVVLNMQPESPHRPATWRFVTLIEVRRGKFSVVFPYTRNPVDLLLREAANLDPTDRTESASLAEAVRAGTKLETWLTEQDERKRSTPASKPRSEEAVTDTEAKELRFDF